MNIQTHMQKNDEALVLAASKGDLDAFNQLVLNYQDLAYRHAYSLLGEPDAAEDIVQESFLKAFQALNAFRGGSFRGWLLRIVTNSAYDSLRSLHRHPTQPLFPEDEKGEEMESAPWLIDSSASVQDVVEQNEFSKSIAKLLEELPDVYRIVLTMIDIHEFDYAEAANALNIPIGTVKSRLARARFQMKNLLENNFHHPQSKRITKQMGQRRAGYYGTLTYDADFDFSSGSDGVHICLLPATPVIGLG
ncbi:MAG TPA: sigma-70 family RNA polymerase sigma factor [Anaerolineales bacterium]